MLLLFVKCQLLDVNGCIQYILLENVGWCFVGFDVYWFMVGKVMVLESVENEFCLVLVVGIVLVLIQYVEYLYIGKCMSLFE